MLNSKAKISTLFAILSYSIFGFSYLFTKSILQLTTPFVLIAVRFIFAFVLLNVLWGLKVIKLNFKGKNILPVLFLGLVQPVAYFLCETVALEMLSTSVMGTILALCPVITIIGGAILLKEKVSLIQIICAITSVFGVFLTTISEPSGSSTTLGVLLAVGAVVSGMAFNLISRKTSEKFSAFERTYVMFGLGSVVFAIIALLTARNDMYNLIVVPFKSIDFWIAIIYLGGVSSVCAFYFLNYSMTYLPVAKVSIFNNLTSVITIISGIVFLKEAFDVNQIIGSLIVVASVFIVLFKQNQNEKQAKI